MKQLETTCSWKESVIYELYIRSFQDSNGDGIGDLQGIVSRLDYLQELGIDAIWLTPIFDSPNVDFGYDVSDYYSIHPEYGTMEDFEQLLEEVHQRNIRMIMELIPNHTSDEHHWFQEARKSKDNPYRDYYIWRPGKTDSEPPNNWTSFLGDPAWVYDEQTKEYYFHTYSTHQPDLNWENPELRQEMYRMMRFWLDKGVDGFRIDAANILSKDTSFPDSDDLGRMQANGEKFYKNGQRIHEYLHEMNQEVFSRYPIFTMGESSQVTTEDVQLYTHPEREELDMILMIEASQVCNAEHDMWEDCPWKLSKLKVIMNKWLKELDPEAWIGMYLSNHDHARLVAYLGDEGEHREQSAKMLAAFLLTLRGTPFILQGEELGMTNADYLHSIDDIKEQQALKYYEVMVNEKGHNEDEILKRILPRARDNARTPVQWDSSHEAGFTTGTAWTRVNNNYTEINAEQQEGNPDSVLNFYRQMIRLRKENPVLTHGTYEPILEENENIFAYLRQNQEECWLVVLNFYSKETKLELPAGIRERMQQAECVICTEQQQAISALDGSVTMKPYDILIYRGLEIESAIKTDPATVLSGE